MFVLISNSILSVCGGGSYRYWIESTMYPSQPGQELVSDKSALCPWPPFYLIRKIDSGKGFPLINQECPTFADERASWEAAERCRGAQSSPHTHSGRKDRGMGFRNGLYGRQRVWAVQSTSKLPPRG